ncbi:uncharacterized protein LOC131843539 [Achroia grisella]|uniref:uncharacterized protein LOC131843539 n=1 Tax=Achroia grisella TaxID=688607 RepID=UPI0027D2A49C|nr:uncharacterized protein LOC131843539 [Achroia grisella]
MDPEKQPLLNPVWNVASSNGFRPLNYEEVLQARYELTWRRARFFLSLMFWAIMAIFLAIIMYILLKAPKCGALNKDAGVVHMTFSPLVSIGKVLPDDTMYAL